MLNPKRSTLTTALALALAGLLAASPALAEKPAWAGNGKPDGQQRGAAKADPRDAREPRHAPDGRERRADSARNASRDREHERERLRDDRSDRDGPRISAYFTDRHRSIVRNYYVEQHRSGSCPPGLAKKRNGCLPPGLAKKWRIGRPLPRDVIYYDAPVSIIVELGMPPELHRYVRVGADILLIHVGTRMVIDAVEDLSRF